MLTVQKMWFRQTVLGIIKASIYAPRIKVNVKSINFEYLQVIINILSIHIEYSLPKTNYL